jgi:hypothetical protein
VYESTKRVYGSTEEISKSVGISIMRSRSGRNYIRSDSRRGRSGREGRDYNSKSSSSSPEVLSS